MLLYEYYCVANHIPQIQHEGSLVRDAEQQIQNAASNIDGAIKYIIDAKNNHPNRIDICDGSIGRPGGFGGHSDSQGTMGGTATSANPLSGNSFGTSAAPTTSAFGRPSGLGQQTNAFGAPAQHNTGAFGQPSTLGQRPNAFGGSTVQPSTGLFGQPSGLGQKPNPFGGGPAQPTTGAFGQPSGLTQKPNPFGGGAAQQSVFGQRSGLGPKPSVFSGNPAQGSAGVFGQPSGLGQQMIGTAPTHQTLSNPFGGYASTGSAFGQPTQAIPDVGFGQPTQPKPLGGQTVQNSAPQNSVFGQPSGQNAPTSLTQPANPFGAPSTSQLNPFGQATTQTSNPFHTQPRAPANDPFAPNGTNPASNTAGPPRNGIKPQDTVNGILNSGWERPKALNEYASLEQNGRFTMFNGEKVIYRDGKPGTQSFNGRWKRIWNTTGPVSKDAQTEFPGSLDDTSLEDAYKHLRLNGTFLDGIMPMIPPKVEWCRFDF